MPDTPDEEPIHKPMKPAQESLPDQSHHTIHPGAITPINTINVIIIGSTNCVIGYTILGMGYGKSKPNKEG